jgi:hypothetical protein
MRSSKMIFSKTEIVQTPHVSIAPHYNMNSSNITHVQNNNIYQVRQHMIKTIRR